MFDINVLCIGSANSAQFGGGWSETGSETLQAAYTTAEQATKVQVRAGLLKRATVVQDCLQVWTVLQEHGERSSIHHQSVDHLLSNLVGLPGPLSELRPLPRRLGSEPALWPMWCRRSGRPSWPPLARERHRGRGPAGAGLGNLSKCIGFYNKN